MYHAFFMEERSLEIQTYTISVQNSPRTWERLHTFHHVWEKIITTCAVWEHKAKRRHCTYHHPHKTGAIFPSTYLECKIKQIKGTLHNLAFILYQIAHNCNHKMIILCHMCICRAGSGADRPRPRQKWGCNATVCPLRVLPPPGPRWAPEQTLGAHLLTEKHRFATWKCAVQCSCYSSSSSCTLPHPQRESRLYVKHSLLERFAVLVAGLCENLKKFCSSHCYHLHKAICHLSTTHIKTDMFLTQIWQWSSWQKPEER